MQRINSIDKTVLFNPVQCSFEKLKQLEENNLIERGALYLVLDTKQIFLCDNNLNLIPMGKSTGIKFAKKSTNLNNSNTPIIFVEGDFEEGQDNSLPQVNDLIFNSDGCFYRVIEVSNGNVKAIRLTVAGSGGGGGSLAQTNILLTLLNPDPEHKYDVIKKGFESFDIEYEFSSYLDGTSTGSYRLKVFVNENPALDENPSAKIDKTIFQQGINKVTILESWLKEGENEIFVQCIDSYGNPRQISIIRNLINLSIQYINDNIYHIIKNTPKESNNCSLSFKIGGKGFERTIEAKCYLMKNGVNSGAPLLDKRYDNLTKNQESLTIQLDNLTYGIYSLSITAGIKINEVEDFITEHYRILHIPPSGEFTEPLIATYLKESFSSKPLSQGTTLQMQYVFYDPNELQQSKELSLLISNENGLYGSEKKLASSNEQPKEWIVKNYPSGTVNFQIKYSFITDEDFERETTSEEWPVNVEASGLSDVQMRQTPTLYLSAAGKSNDKLDKTSWSYTNPNTNITYTTDFENFNWINDRTTGNGWFLDEENKDPILRLLGQAKAKINFSPYVYDGVKGPIFSGSTVELDFTIRDVNNRDAVALQCYDGKVGFRVTADSITFNGNTETEYEDIDEETGEVVTKTKVFSTSVKYNTNERVHAAIVIEKVETGRTQHLVKLYLNGVLTTAGFYVTSEKYDASNVKYWSGEFFEQAKDANVGIEIGSPDCAIDIYNIRIYDEPLTSQEIVQNFIYDYSGTVLQKKEKIENNDIYSIVNGETIVDYMEVKDKISTMVITGPLPQQKGNKTQVSVEFNSLLDGVPSFSEIYDEKDSKKVSLDIQGTSSVAYSRKNYKLKFQNKHSLGEDQILNKVFCLKADYAEGTSTHNTQNANLIHEFYSVDSPGKNLDNDLSWKTPPQAFEEDGNKYRTTIYGFPIVLFWQEKKDSPKVFMGKYNFNFDKGSEEVFGFNYNPEDNSGYKGECWEFCHNKPTCRFLTPLADNWFDDFEPRYFIPYNYTVEDENSLFYNKTITISYDGEAPKDPNNPTDDEIWYVEDVDGVKINKYYLNDGIEILHKKSNRTKIEDELLQIQLNQAIKNFKIMYDWVRSTDVSLADNKELDEPYTDSDGYTIYTNDTKEYRLAKFKKEFQKYFNLHFSLIYYIYTFFGLMVDQRAKNMFLTYWEDTKVWSPWFYDNDTCFGIDNTGEWEFDYYHEDTDKIGLTGNVYNGQDSILWVNFREAFKDEIKSTYQRLRDDKYITYDKMLDRFITQGSDKWSESIYNEDSEFKYITEFYEKDDTKWLTQGIKGTGEEHLRYFMKNRIDYCDSKWQSSDYINDSILLRIYTPEVWSGVAPSNKIEITPFTTMYPGINYASTSIETSNKKVEAGETYVFDKPDAHFNDTETSIYGASNIQSLGDLSPLYLGLLSVGNATKLIDLKIGSEKEGYSNRFLKSLSIGKNKLLKELDISNCKALSQTLNLIECPSIEIVKAKGSIISGINFSSAGNLKTLELPGTIKILDLANQPLLNNLSIDQGIYIKDYFIDDIISEDIYNIIIKFMIEDGQYSDNLTELNTKVEKQTTEIIGYQSTSYLTALEEYQFNVGDSLPKLLYSNIERLEKDGNYKPVGSNIDNENDENDNNIIELKDYFEETENQIICIQTAKVLIAKTYIDNDILTNEQYSRIKILNVNGKETNDIEKYFSQKTIQKNSYYKILENISVQLNRGYVNLETVKIQNCPLIKTRQILDQVINGNYQKNLKVRITGIDYTKDSDWHFENADYLLRFLKDDCNITGLEIKDGKEVPVDFPCFVGTCKINDLKGEELALLKPFIEKGLNIVYDGLISIVNFYIGGEIVEDGIENIYQLKYKAQEIINKNEYDQIFEIIETTGNDLVKENNFEQVEQQYKCKYDITVKSNLVNKIKIAPAQEIFSSSENIAPPEGFTSIVDNPINPVDSKNAFYREFIRLPSPKLNYGDITGWSLAPGGKASSNIFSKIKGNTDVYLSFSSTRRNHTLSFYRLPEDNTPFRTISVPYGDTIQEIPSLLVGDYPSAKPPEEYLFSGWDPEITLTTIITEAKRYNAKFSYIAYFNNKLIERDLAEYVDEDLESIGDYAFYGCEELKIVNTPSVLSIGKSSFENCSILDTLILLNENRVCSLGENALKGTLIEQGHGTVYVADNMVNLYQNNRDWSNYKNNIKSINELTILEVNE